jgi:hypothetical protein
MIRLIIKNLHGTQFGVQLNYNSLIISSKQPVISVVHIPICLIGES